MLLMEPPSLAHMIHFASGLHSSFHVLTFTVFTFILLSSEERAGEAWTPTNKLMLFSPPEKRHPLLPPL